MRKHSCSLMMRIISVIYLLISLANAASSLELYVSDEFSEGTKEHHYSTIDDAFGDLISSKFEESLNFTIYLAPREEPYFLKNGGYTLNGKIGSARSSLKISTWPDYPGRKTEELATLEFDEADIVMLDLSLLSFEDLKIIGARATWTLTRSDFSVNNVEMLGEFGYREPFIRVNQGSHLSVNQLKLNFTEYCTFIIFKNMNADDKSQITLQDININYQAKLRSDDENGVLYSALFHFETNPGDKSTDISIERFRFQFPESEFYFHPGPILYASGFNLMTWDCLDFAGFSGKLAAAIPWMKFDQFRTVEIDCINIKENNISARGTSHLIGFSRGKNVFFNNLSFSKNFISSNEDSAFQFFGLNDMSGINFLNHSVTDNNLPCEFSLFRAGDAKTSSMVTYAYPRVQIKDVRFLNNINSKSGTSKELFSYIALQREVLDQVVISNVEYRNNSLIGRIFSFTNQPSKRSPKLLYAKTVAINLTNITITENLNAEDMVFFYFFPQEEFYAGDYDCNQMFELYSISINNTVVANNQFMKKFSPIALYEMALFQSKQAAVRCYNLTVENNVFERYSFYSLSQRPASFLLSSSNFTNNSLTSSQLVDSNYMEGYYCNSFKDKLLPFHSLLYKYVMILNSSFSSLQLVSSKLFNLNTGFLFLQENDFSSLYFREQSMFMTNSFYQTVKTSYPIAFYRNLSLEASVLKDRPEAWEVFNNTMIREQQDVTYITSISGNNWNDMLSESEQLISLSLSSRFFTQGYVQIETNSFFSVKLKGSASSSLISIDSFMTARIKNNSFVFLNGNFAIFSLAQGQKSRTLEADSNYIAYANTKGFLLYTGDSIKTIYVTNNTFYINTFSQACISVDVNLAFDTWIFDENDFEKVDLDVDVTNKQRESYGLITIYSSNVSENSLDLILSNTRFENMNLGRNKTRSGQTNLLSLKTMQAIIISNITVENVGIFNQGPLIGISSPTSFSLEDSSFRNVNTNSSAGMITLASEVSKIKNTNFISMASEDGSGIFSLTALLKNYTVEISECDFQTLDFRKLGAVVAIQTLESIKSSSVSPYSVHLEINACTITRFRSGSVVFLSGVNCIDCRVENTLIDAKVYFGSTLGGGVFTLIDGVFGNLDLNNLIIMRPQFIYGPFIYMINSAAEVSLSNSDYNGSKKEFYLGLLDSGTLIIRNSNFENVSKDKFPFINIISTEGVVEGAHRQLKANVRLENSSFRDFSYDGGSLLGFAFYSNPLDYEHSIGVKPFGVPFILAVILTNLSVENCKFENFDNIPILLMSRSSGPVNKFTKNLSSSITVKDSVFRDNRFFLGPCMTVLPKAYSPKIKISNSLFEGNVGSVGGAIVAYNSSLEISDSSFIGNLGLSIGRAIFMGGTTLEKNDLTKNVTFSGNQGEYEGDVCSEAVDFRLKFISEEQTSIQQEQKMDGLLLTEVTTQELQKGKLLLEYIDIYGNPTPDLSSSAQGSYELRTSNGKFEGESVKTFTGFLEHSKRTTSNLSLSNVIITGDGDQEFVLNLRYISDRINQNKSIHVKIRPCRAGEFNNTKLGVCQACVSPTYSLNPSEPCTKCPANTKCTNQSKIIPQEGYWSSPNAPIDIHKCREDHIIRCKNDDDEKQSCADGYTGPLCEACDFNNSYFEKSYLECRKCQDPDQSLKYGMIVAGVYFLYQIFSIIAIYTANSENKNIANDYLWKRKVERAYYLKSFLTYTQIMSLLYMDSGHLYHDFGLTSQIGNPSSMIAYGTQCSMKAFGIQNYDLIFYQVYMILATPFVQLVAFGCVLLLICRFMDSLKVGKVLQVATLYFIVSYQPGIVTNLAQFLSCKTIGDQTYIASHAFWSCKDSRYQTVAGLIARPSLVAWCFVIPVIVLVALVYKKKKCESEEINMSFGMITNDVKLEFYYWGVILMVLKLVISILVYGLQREAETHIFICLILLWGYQRLVRWKQPYKAKAFNNFEMTMINLLMLNIVMVRYFMNSGEIEIKVGSLVVSVIINGGFVLMVVWKIISLSFIDILSKFERHVMSRRTTRASELNENFDLQL